MIPFVTRLSVPSPFSYQTLVTTDKISPNKGKKIPSSETLASDRISVYNYST